MLLLIFHRLDVAEFKPPREHRKALHRWEKFVVGQSYISECAIRYPKTKEFVIHLWLYELPAALCCGKADIGIQGEKEASK